MLWPMKLQAQMLIELGRRTARSTTWFLRSRRLAEPMATTIARFAPAAATLQEFFAAVESTAPWRASIAEREQALVAQGVPAPLAFKVASADMSFAALDIAEVSESAGQPLVAVAEAYFAIGGLLGLAVCGHRCRRCQLMDTGRAWPRIRLAMIWPRCSGS